jgi:hypothetical protein
LDPAELVDEIEKDPKFYYRRGLTLAHAQGMLDKVERLDQHFRVQREASRSGKFEAAKAVTSLTRVTKGQTPKYWTITRPN